MRLPRGLHAAAIATGVAVVVGAAAGQAPSPSPSPAPAPKPAAAPVLVPDGGAVPDYQSGPPRFAVVPFENQSGVQAFDWLVAAAPFEIAEKTEDVLGLEPTGGALHVGREAVPPEQDPVAAFGAAREAPWVITGWVDRPRWLLRIGIVLWKVAGGTAVVVAETQRTGEVKAYHQLLGDALADAWAAGGVPVDVDRRQRLGRALATDVYAVNLMGRGLGYLTGALGGASNLKVAEHDLERAVFIDPKCYEAQRLLGELYLAQAADPKAAEAPRLAARAAGKFAYASDLAPTDIATLRAAAAAAARQSKHELARDLARRLVTRRPWDLDARYAYGAALWQTGDGAGAQRQLEQVTERKPDHLPARRVLVLIHASRGDTSKLVGELEAIAMRAPADLEVKADLATAYGAIGRWDSAAAALEAIAAARVPDLALLVRIGDAKRRLADLPGALAWYGRAAKLAPESSYPGFAAAQALYDAGKLTEAAAAYTQLQRYRDDAPAAQQALAAVALQQGRADDAAVLMRRAVRDAPRSLVGWRTLAAAELARKDARAALAALDRALAAWPRDGQLLYLAGIGHEQLGDRALARDSFMKAEAAQPGHPGARAALSALDIGGAVTLLAPPELVRPWGDAKAIDEALARYAAVAKEMAAARAAYQDQVLSLLAVLGEGPYAAGKPPPQGRTCPVARLAPLWGTAQRELRRSERLGAELELAHRFVLRHDELGATAALLPNARAQVAAVKQAFRTALADAGELRAEWDRSVLPQLQVVGCYDKLLAAAFADPERYRMIQEDRPVTPPVQQAPRPRPRATFYVDNTRCADPVDVFVDGAQIGQVAPGRRSGLVADGGERTLCLILPGAAQCGDRGTVRQVYLHDGWAATVHCPK